MVLLQITGKTKEEADFLAYKLLLNKPGLNSIIL